MDGLLAGAPNPSLNLFLLVPYQPPGPSFPEPLSKCVVFCFTALQGPSLVQEKAQIHSMAYYSHGLRIFPVVFSSKGFVHILFAGGGGEERLVTEAPAPCCHKFNEGDRGQSQFHLSPLPSLHPLNLLQRPKPCHRRPLGFIPYQLSASVHQPSVLSSYPPC